MAACLPQKIVPVIIFSTFLYRFLDYTAEVNPDLILPALIAMTHAWFTGIPIYVHCKAGVGRSALLVAIWLRFMNALHDAGPEFETFNNFDTIHKFLLTRRPQTNIGHNKKKVIR